MKRWLMPFVAFIALAWGQPVVAAQPGQGTVRTLVDAAGTQCHNPEGIVASPSGLLYTAGLSGNVCVYTLAGSLVRIIPVAPGHALLGELYVPGQGIYIADNNGDFSGGRVIRLDPRTVTLSLASNPPGMQLSLDSDTLTAPFTETVIALFETEVVR